MTTLPNVHESDTLTQRFHISCSSATPSDDGQTAICHCAYHCPGRMGQYIYDKLIACLDDIAKAYQEDLGIQSGDIPPDAHFSINSSMEEVARHTASWICSNIDMCKVERWDDTAHIFNEEWTGPLHAWIADNDEEISADEVEALTRNGELMIGGGAAPLMRVRIND